MHDLAVCADEMANLTLEHRKTKEELLQICVLRRA